MNHKPAVGNAAVVTEQFFRGDKMHRSVVIGKIGRHSLNFILNASLVRIRVCHHIAYPFMLFTCRKLRIAAGTHLFQGRFHGNGVLPGIQHALHPADGIGMPLADPLTPEGIALSLR